MDNPALVLDLIEWIAAGPRSYDDVMNAWQTSCPRFPIWEDTVDAGLVRRVGSRVHATRQGLEFLRAHDRSVPASSQPTR